jgi:hypothetical protein
MNPILPILLLLFFHGSVMSRGQGYAPANGIAVSSADYFALKVVFEQSQTNRSNDHAPSIKTVECPQSEASSPQSGENQKVRDLWQSQSEHSRDGPSA